jgi:hypothetical protein
MPSFRDLPADKKTALVNFLSSLKGKSTERGVQGEGGGGGESSGG